MAFNEAHVGPLNCKPPAIVPQRRRRWAAGGGAALMSGAPLNGGGYIAVPVAD